MPAADSGVGLYIHVPFCASKCRYCDFYSTVLSKEWVDRFVSLLEREWLLRCRESPLDKLPIATVYIGGGTPSLLPESVWERLIDFVVRVAGTTVREWTVEVNPDSAEIAKIALWKSAGVTRLSLGIQSLNSKELRFLGRRHSAQQALTALERCYDAGFCDIGADIMYALPGQRPGDLLCTVNTLIDTKILTHVSAYELTVSPTCRLGRHRRLFALPDPDTAQVLFSGLRECLVQAGFEHYEVSNYALPGFRSMHNSSYWAHVPYIGLGPSAHSYFCGCRSSNYSDICVWSNALDNDALPQDFAENIDNEQLETEMIMLGLRTSDGLSVDRIEKACGRRFLTPQRKGFLDQLVNNNLVKREAGKVVPTQKGMLMADGIARVLCNAPESGLSQEGRGR